VSGLKRSACSSSSIRQETIGFVINLPESTLSTAGTCEPPEMVFLPFSLSFMVIWPLFFPGHSYSSYISNRIRYILKILTDLCDDLRFIPPAIDKIPDHFSASVKSKRCTGIPIYEQDIVIKGRAGEHGRVLNGYII
jgi:hypothetical protein